MIADDEAGAEKVYAEKIYAALRSYWGYEQFRPLQEKIISSLLAGHDLAAIMPTGGGKSLCYQLPAAVSGGTAVVISPLIALMQDQMQQLRQMGIPAAILNSSVTSSEQSQVMKDAIQGAFRLIYLSPERIANPATIQWLARVPVTFFAIDEAHCISEWGHEFRPEYRQLRLLRESFPDKPIAAFTASATQQVRHDILRQLQLRDPHRYILSFYRPNLRYIVRECKEKEQRSLLLAAIEQHAGSPLIVYAPTVRTVEEITTFLGASGIPAISYHGKMEKSERQRNQETWMSDEVPVLVGTLAFGLGINKPSVRAVIHLSLPKSVEQYYQESGRAGRDGAPADCILLWRKSDTALLAHFISELTDPQEQQNAWARYRAIKNFVESRTCRPAQICRYFGERPKWEPCGMCDVCVTAPEWLVADPFTEVHVPATAARRATIPTRERLTSVASPVARKYVESQADPRLVAHMKVWRKEIAKDRQLAAFIVMHDSTLEDLCRKQPRNLSELLAVSGIGENKARTYGESILKALRAFKDAEAG